MPKRDKTGKFVKVESEGYKFMLTFPPLKKIICWVFIFIDFALALHCIQVRYTKSAPGKNGRIINEI